MELDTTYIKKEQKKIASAVTKKFQQYYLTGGTALAFYLNHRFSEDLDFFTQSYKKEEPDQIMNFISEQTGFEFGLELEQKDPKLVPMKIYYLTLNKGLPLKVDFVQDFHKNINKIKNGLHSIEDIYYRKIMAAIGSVSKESITGKLIPSGRQTVKDFYDLYTLSKKHNLLSDFFLEHFSADKAELLIDWYKRFNRMKLQMELLDFAQDVDTREVFLYMDKEILKNLPDKII